MGGAPSLAQLQAKAVPNRKTPPDRHTKRIVAASLTFATIPGAIPPAAVHGVADALGGIPQKIPGVTDATNRVVQSFLRNPQVQAFERTFSLFTDASAADNPQPPHTQQELQAQVKAIQDQADAAKQAVLQPDQDFAKGAANHRVALKWVADQKGVGGYGDFGFSGWCTDWVEQNTGIKERTAGYVHGDAGQWIAEVNAFNSTPGPYASVAVLDHPVVGGIAVWSGPYNWETGRASGHVAVITWVSADGKTYGGYEMAWVGKPVSANVGSGIVTPFTSHIGEVRNAGTATHPFYLTPAGFIDNSPETKAHLAALQTQEDTIQKNADAQKLVLAQEFAQFAAQQLGDTYTQAEQQLQSSTAKATQANDAAKKARDDAATVVNAWHASSALAADEANVKTDQANLTIAQANLAAATKARDQAEATGVNLDAAATNFGQAQQTFDLAQSQFDHDSKKLAYDTDLNAKAQAALPPELQGQDLQTLAQSKAQDAVTASNAALAAAQQQQKDALAAQAAAQAIVDQRNAIISMLGDVNGGVMTHDIKLLDQAQANLDQAKADLIAANKNLDLAKGISSTSTDVQSVASGKQSSGPEVVVPQVQAPGNGTTDNKGKPTTPDNQRQVPDKKDQSTTNPQTGQTGTPPGSTSGTQTPGTSTPGQTTPVDTPVAGKEVTFVMQQDLAGGLSQVAAGEGITLDQLMAVNPQIKPGDPVTVNEIIILPSGTKPTDYNAHLVLQGDDINAIAKLYGYSVDDLTKDNPGVDLTKLKPGELIFFSQPLDNSNSGYQLVHDAEASGAAGSNLVTAVAAQLSQSPAGQSESAQGQDPRVAAQALIDATTKADKVIADQRAAMQATGGPTDQLIAALTPPAAAPPTNPVVPPTKKSDPPPAAVPDRSAYPAAWLTWADATLKGIGAPDSNQNLDSLWHWSVQESGNNVMRWDNPLNTTQWEPGAVAENTLSNPNWHVYSYPDVQTGVTATVATLEDGYYPHILSDLQHSVPREQWTDATKDLKTWGTGTAWLDS